MFVEVTFLCRRCGKRLRLKMKNSYQGIQSEPELNSCFKISFDVIIAPARKFLHVFFDRCREVVHEVLRLNSSVRALNVTRNF